MTSENNWFPEVNSGSDFRDPQNAGPPDLGSASGNKTRRRGGRADCRARGDPGRQCGRARADRAGGADPARLSIPGSPVPGLAGRRRCARRSHGDPLTQPAARDWAVRDYRRYLLRGADPKRSVRYANNALAAVDDFHVRRGLGRPASPAMTCPRPAPRALADNAQIRWVGAVQAWPRVRDRALALLPLYAGLRIGNAVALDVNDVRISARTGELVVYGKAGKVRTVPVAAPLRKPLQDWLDERRTWPGTSDTKALFLNRRGGWLSARSASDVLTAIAENAGLDAPATAHVGRDTFINELIRGGETRSWSPSSPVTPAWRHCASTASPPRPTSRTRSATCPSTAEC